MIVMVALESISKTRTKLSRDVEAAIVPLGCAATATTPSKCPANNIENKIKKEDPR
jgi:hypothetical protein